MERPQSTLGLLRWIGVTQRKAADEWARDRGLTMEQAFTIGYLRENPGAKQRDVALVSRTTAASASSILQGLERRGLVERRSEEGDERSKRVYATDAAVALVDGFDVAMAATDDSILSPLDDAERATLDALLLKIVNRLPGLSRP